MANIEEVVNEVRLERQKQDAQWGGATHDDQHADRDWLGYIHYQVGAAYMQPERLRERLIKIAALSVAAIESLDRKSHGK